MKKHGLLLLVLALLCLSAFSAAAYADDSLYHLEHTQLQTTFNGRTTIQNLDKPYETWYFLNDGSVYVSTGERYTYTTGVVAGKTVLRLNRGIFDDRQIILDTDSASAVSTYGSVTSTYVFNILHNALFSAVIDSAYQSGSMLQYTWHTVGGNGAIMYRYHIYDSENTLVESGTTTEESFRFMPGKDDSYTLFLTAVDADRDVSEYDSVKTVYAGDPDYVIMDDGTITAYTGTGTEAFVPDFIAGNEVKGIGPRVFSNASTLEKIYLPNNLTEIAVNAFSGSHAKIICMSKNNDGEPTATALELSKRRLSFYDNFDVNCAFELMYMEFLGTADTLERKLVLTSYSGTEKNVMIPHNVEYIYNNAFKENARLESVYIHDEVTGIGQNAFIDCSRLAKVSFNPGAALKSISDGAFEGCGSLKTLMLPQNLLSIGERAFANCEALERLDLLSHTVKSIGASAFYNCPVDIYCPVTGILDTAKAVSRLSKPVFWKPDSSDLTLELHYDSEKDYWVLYSCTGSGLNLEIPDIVNVIAANTFKGNKILENVKISASVNQIGANAFQGCTKLKTVTIVPGLKLTDIGDYAFNGCSMLGSIDLPANLRNIGMHAFSECNAMDEITIPDSVRAIGANAFYNGPKKIYCSRYDNSPAILVSASQHTFWYKEGTNTEMELRWENNNTELVLYSYHSNSGPVLVIVPQYVTKLMADAFNDMKDTLQSVEIPASVTVLPTGLFDGHFRLKEIKFVTGTRLENRAIRDCIELERVTGLSDLSVIDNNFENCPKLMLDMPYQELCLSTQIDFAKKALLTKLPTNAVILYTNGKVAQLNKADGVVTAYSEGYTRIYMYADGKVGSCGVMVYGDLTGLKLPAKLKTLEQDAFMGNSFFEYVLLPNGLTAIGDRAFANDEQLALVYIPDSVTSFGGPDIFPKTAVLVFSKSNSTAWDYCTTNGISWQYMP